MDVTRVSSNSVEYQPPVPPPARVGGETAVQAPAQASPVADSQPYPDSRESSEALSRAVRAINSTIAAYSRHLNISFHEPTGRNIVSVYNSETNEVIREIPPQRVLDAHASLLELAGLFVDTRG